MVPVRGLFKEIVMLSVSNLCSAAKVVYKEDFDEIHTYDNEIHTAFERPGQTITKPGTWFIFSGNFPYYHLLIDAIASYEYLKTVYPDIKLGIFWTQERGKEEKRIQRSSLLQYIIDEYGPEMIFFQDYVYVFEHCVSITNDIDNHNVFEHSGVKYGIASNLKWSDKELGANIDGNRIRLLKYLRNKIFSSVDPNPSLPKKIFSFRNGDALSELSIPHPNSQDYRSRKYEHEEAIINYFIDLGYTPVDFSKMSFIEQVQHAMNATHYAGLKGSNMMNAVFSSPTTVVTEMIVCNWWNYGFDAYFKSLGQTVNEFGRYESLSFTQDKLEKRHSSELIAWLETLENL